MQIDYICLSRVFLEDLAGAFGLPRSQEFALLADLNVGGEPEVRHCGGIRKPAMTPSEAIQRRPSRAYTPFSHSK